MNDSPNPGHGLQLVRMRAEEHLNAVLELFKPGAQVTLFVRNPDGEQAPGAKDFVLSSDDPKEVAVMLARWFAAERVAAPAGSQCGASPDHADIIETIENAADGWQQQGYTSALAEVRDMANVGRALMAALPEGYSYMNCPSEIVSDLQNERDEAASNAKKAMGVTGNAILLLGYAGGCLLGAPDPLYAVEETNPGAGTLQVRRNGTDNIYQISVVQLEGIE